MTDTPRTDAAAADLLEAVERLWVQPSFKRMIYNFVEFVRGRERKEYLGYIYLASPYFHPQPEVMEERYQSVLQVALKLLQCEQYVYSPIVHNHPIALAGELPRDFSYWENFDTAMLRGAHTCLILTIQDWKESRGIKAEVDIAKTLGIPIKFIDAEGHITC